MLEHLQSQVYGNLGGDNLTNINFDAVACCILTKSISTTLSFFKGKCSTQECGVPTTINEKFIVSLLS